MLKGTPNRFPEEVVCRLKLSKEMLWLALLALKKSCQRKSNDSVRTHSFFDRLHSVMVEPSAPNKKNSL